VEAVPDRPCRDAHGAGDVDAGHPGHHRHGHDLPQAPDTVQVFRPSEEAPDIARQAVEVGAKALWLQVGITSPEARSIAMDTGMAYVEDDCMGQVRDRHDISKV
jgi:uncharacterized protein